MGPIVLVVVTVAAEESSELLVQAFDLPIGLWVIAGGKTDVNVKCLTEG